MRRKLTEPLETRGSASTVPLYGSAPNRGADSTLDGCDVLHLPTFGTRHKPFRLRSFAARSFRPIVSDDSDADAGAVEVLDVVVVVGVGSFPLFWLGLWLLQIYSSVSDVDKREKHLAA